MNLFISDFTIPLTSKPLDAGRDIHALANSASNLSNTGDPSPAGTLRATTSTTPPILLPVRLFNKDRILDNFV